MSLSLYPVSGFDNQQPPESEVDTLANRPLIISDFANDIEQWTGYSLRSLIQPSGCRVVAEAIRQQVALREVEHFCDCDYCGYETPPPLRLSISQASEVARWFDEIADRGWGSMGSY